MPFYQIFMNVFLFVLAHGMLKQNRVKLSICGEGPADQLPRRDCIIFTDYFRSAASGHIIDGRTQKRGDSKQGWHLSKNHILNSYFLDCAAVLFIFGKKALKKLQFFTQRASV